MDFKKNPKKVKRVSGVSQKNRGKTSKTRSIQAVDNRKLSFLEKADIAEKAVISHTKKMFFGRFENLSNVRKPIIIWICVMALLISTIGLFRWLSDRNFSEEVFSRGGTYSEGILGEVKSLNPIFATTDAEKSFERLAFSRLYSIDSDGSLKGDLAENVETSDNYRNFTIKMRKNATWSDGQKITADDVIFTIKNLKDQNLNPSAYKVWKNVEASKTGDYEIKFKVPSNSSSVLYGFNFSILPEHILKDVSTDKIRESSFSNNPITSGPFNFKGVQTNGNKTTVSLVKNKNYYKGEPYIDNFDIVVFQDEARLKKALISGEIVASPSVKISDFSNSERAGLNSHEISVNRGIYAFMNNSDPILKDAKVRKAIQTGLDVNKIRSKMEYINNLDYPTLSKFINTNWLSVPEYNFAQAEKMLDEAGWVKNSKGIREKDGQKATINVSTTSIYNYKKSAEEIASQLKKLGFDVNTTIIDKDDKLGTFVQTILQPRNYGILVYEVDMGADSDIYPFWHSSQASQKGLNFSNYSDAIADDLLLNARTAQTFDDKKTQLTKFTRRWINNSVAIGLGQTKVSYVFRKSVQPYSAGNKFVVDIDRYSDVIYWSAKKETLYKTP